jgi:hypothetical protein
LNYADDFQIPDNAFLGVWDVFAVQPIHETLEAGHIYCKVIKLNFYFAKYRKQKIKYIIKMQEENETNNCTDENRCEDCTHCARTKPCSCGCGLLGGSCYVGYSFDTGEDLKTILEEVSFEDLCEYVMGMDGSDVSEGWTKESIIEMIIQMVAKY